MLTVELPKVIVVGLMTRFAPTATPVELTDVLDRGETKISVVEFPVV